MRTVHEDANRYVSHRTCSAAIVLSEIRVSCEPVRAIDGITTIASLHIGHTSLELAAAATALFACSGNDVLEARSVSVVVAGVFEVEELRDTELSDGESRLALRTC